MTRIAARQVLATDVNERDFQAVVIDLARGLGWGITRPAQQRLAEEAEQYHVAEPELDGLVFHPRYSLGSEPGWPDLTLIRRRDRRLIFAELKAEKGRLSHRQEQVIDLLRCIEGDRVLCGNGPHQRGADGLEVRSACCWPWVQVFVWRPSDLDKIREELL